VRRWAVVLAAAVTAGCAVGPRYRRPERPLPDRFYGQAEAASAPSLADAPWWDVFGDPVLRGLVDEALRNGYDARLAAARVEEARARYGVARAGLSPEIDARVQGQVGHTPRSGDSGDKTGGLVTIGLGASWEVDFWGRLRRLDEAARAQYLASEEGRRSALLALVADVASTYFDLRELDDELVIARRAADAFGDAYDLFNRRMEGGAASGLETARAEAAFATARAQIPLLERRLVAAENELDLLLGRAPGPIARGGDAVLAAVPNSVPAGLPAALLERRPDVRQAEQQLIAANANVGAAQAALLPTFSLTGLLGGVSSDLAALVGDGKVWTVTGGLVQPLLNGGRLRRQRDVALAQREQALVQYERAVTTALGDVSTALVAVQKLGEAESERARSLAANEEAVRLSSLRYDAGFSAYFEVLDALQLRLNAENAFAQTRHDRRQALVQLYKSLGGGWPLEPGAR
jgi:multidrug efflux system outer membrane protein